MTNVTLCLPTQTNLFLRLTISHLLQEGFLNYKFPFLSPPKCLCTAAVAISGLGCQSLHCSLSLHICAISIPPGPLQCLYKSSVLQVRMLRPRGVQAKVCIVGKSAGLDWCQISALYHILPPAPFHASRPLDLISGPSLYITE